MQAKRWSTGIAHSFLTLALDTGKWLTSSSGRFTPGEGGWYPLNRRMGGPQNQSGHFGQEKNLLPLQKFNPRPKPIVHTLYQLCPSGSLDYELQK